MAAKLIYEHTIGETQNFINGFLLFFHLLLPKVMEMDGRKLQTEVIS